MKEMFLEAIKNKKKVKIKIFNKDKQEVNELICIPFNLSPPKNDSFSEPVFHFYNLDDPKFETYFIVKPTDLYSIEITNNSFDPTQSN